MAFPPHPHPMIKVLFWNCSGIGSFPTNTMLHHFIGSHSLDLIFLAEPKLSMTPPSPLAFSLLVLTLPFQIQTTPFGVFANKSPTTITLFLISLTNMFLLLLLIFLPFLLAFSLVSMAPHITELEELYGIT